MAATVPPQEIVYHYTTMDTMTKIAQNASILATSISYLNDVSEGDYFLELIRDRIPTYRKTHTLEDEKIFDIFLDKSHRVFESRPFVASFSEEADSLPQWRSYCPNGNGVAIGFRADCLKRALVQPLNELKGAEPAQRTPLVFYREVDYLDDVTLQSLDAEIDWVIVASKYAAQKNVSHDGDVNYSVSEYFKVIAERLACFKKHPSFSNEREHRLLVDNVHRNRDYLGFKATPSTLRPYISVNIPRKHSSYKAADAKPAEGSVSEAVYTALGGRWDFIDRVVIGPTTNKDLSLEAVTSFFLKLQMRVEVRSSKVPFRDW
jgi:Protein of unknown function (DUF2971)